MEDTPIRSSRFIRPQSPGQFAQVACLLEVTARKPGNVHRYADLPGLRFIDFLLSAMAIAEPLDQAAATGVGRAVLVCDRGNAAGREHEHQPGDRLAARSAGGRSARCQSR